jgi:outer membrane protein assembly factor BamE (lipoprotein component of BamABCDE complex)
MPSASSPHRRWVALTVTFALLATTLAGCATRGVEFEVDKIPRLEKGVTTREDVDGWFGRPVSLEQRSSGFSVYRYFHEETTTRDTGFFTRIGAFIAGFFGFRGYRSPVNVRYQNRVRHQLIIAFDPDGVVSSHRYERTDMPSKQVY